jgi:hypothetical protein
VENRRAPARGGHGIHWREGTNRSAYRHKNRIDETQNSGKDVKWNWVE